MSKSNSLTLAGFGLRFLFALLLVFITYNPEGYSYYHWVSTDFSTFNAVKAFAGVILLVAWAIYIRATAHSLGMIGLILAALFFGTLIWVMIDFGLVSVGSLRSMSYVVEVMLVCVMAIGLSWSHIRRRMTGQIDVDDDE
ncbi:MAG: DUF6524 family protein [bacterium]